jgi:hypothetical protein
MIPAQEIARSPAWFPLERLAPDAVRLVKLDESAYARASFLDQRLLGQGYPQAHCTRAELAAAATGLMLEARYVFHIGHVGSTLIARLLGAHPAYFALREPALLRTFPLPLPPAAATDLEVLLRLFSRTWHAPQRALIKVTSFASDLAEGVLGSGDSARAVFMFAQPLTYLRTILAGPNSRREAQQLAGLRLARLARRLGAPARAPRFEGEYLAMSWLCEMTALAQAAAAHPARILWVDFDHFLTDPVASLVRISAALGEPLTPAAAASLVAGPLMRQYSKAPEHAYDAALRRAVLAAAEAEHGTELSRGIAWLTACAEHAPAARAVLELATARAAPD